LHGGVIGEGVIGKGVIGEGVIGKGIRGNPKRVTAYLTPYPFSDYPSPLLRLSLAHPMNSCIFAAAIGGIAQLARALAWHARGHRFESDYLHFKNPELVDFKRVRDFFLVIKPTISPHFFRGDFRGDFDN
jgi:hypothetical protein